MKKLVELLYKYQKVKCFYPLYYDVEENKIYLDSDARIGAEQYLISKDFGFIEWLVENNKINKRKIDTRLVRYVENHYDEEGYWVESSYENYSDSNTLIMLLAISYTPIEDLISYLR